MTHSTNAAPGKTYLFSSPFQGLTLRGMAERDEDKTDPFLAIPSELRAPAAPPIPVRMPELGPIDALMKDPAISEIMINDLRNVMIEKSGQMIFSGYSVQSIDELNRITRNILEITGRILSPDSPYVDVMLPDGSRVNLVGPPLTLIGPCITIRKFPQKTFTIEELMRVGSMDRRIAYFLNVCVVGKINILISGGTGTGKTSFLNALLGFVPKGERLVTIEDTPELQIHHANSVRMQTKPASPASAAVGARDLVANALRMRPDRIVIGEIRKAEAFDFLQAMNTGHEGSFSTIHANSPREALTRLENLCMTAGVDLPLLAIRRQIASAVDLVIQLKRFRSGKRRILLISEITGMEGETVTTQDLFRFITQSTEFKAEGEIGEFEATGLPPKLTEKLKEMGLEFPPNYFA